MALALAGGFLLPFVGSLSFGLALAEGNSRFVSPLSQGDQQSVVAAFVVTVKDVQRGQLLPYLALLQPKRDDEDGAVRLLQNLTKMTIPMLRSD